MTASAPTSLPLAAVDLFDDGHAWYPFRTSPNAITLFAYSPELRSPQWQWVNASADEPHAVMPLDAAHLAQLMFLAPVGPDGIDGAELLTLLPGLLTLWHCDPAAVLDTVADEFGEWPEQSAAHMQRCIIAASRLLGVEI